MRMLSVAVAIVLGLGALAQAAPLELKHVAADAKWVMHLDVDAVRASTVVQKGYHKCLEMHKEVAQHLDKVRDMIGMDPRTDLHGITCYGPQVGKHQGVLIVQADMNQQLLVDKAKLGPDHMVTKYGACELHSWTHKKGDRQHHATGAFFTPKVLVFGGSVEEVKAGLDVLSGKSASLAGKPSALDGDIAPGTTFVHRAIDVGAHTKCPVLKQAQSYCVSTGENKGESFFRARFIMNTTESADQVKAILEGFKAMAALHAAADAEGAKLIEALKVTREDKTLAIQWSVSADAVWAEIEKLGKKIAECKAKGGQCPWGQCPLMKHKPDPKK